MGTGGPFPGAKARPGRDTENSPPPSAEVKNEELYLLSPQAPPWRVVGQLYFSILLYLFCFNLLYSVFCSERTPLCSSLRPGPAICLYPPKLSHTNRSVGAYVISLQA
jgi:hypothetical protein